MVANRVAAVTVVSKAAGAGAGHSKAAGVADSSSPPVVAAADGEETVPEAKEDGDKTAEDLVTPTATPVGEGVLEVVLEVAAAPCDLEVLAEEIVRCLTGTTEGVAGAEGVATAGTELLPPISSSTMLIAQAPIMSKKSSR